LAKAVDPSGPQLIGSISGPKADLVIDELDFEAILQRMQGWAMA
jgi:hypothetical protein